MKITVNRVASTDDETLSIVSVDGKVQCFGLEDEYREDKIIGETRIPAGEYKVTLRTVGGFHNRYSERFSSFHKGMLWVRDVPGFEYILIHVGNTDEDTAGCLLVGDGAIIPDSIKITQSTFAYKNLYQKVLTSAMAGTLYIEYLDNDLTAL